jgi:uncharacterized protein YabE (DUF348 family)
VHEVVELNQTAIPYDSEIVENPELELDQREVMQPGQYGVQVSRVRVRYEDGQEVSRNTESEWTAAHRLREGRLWLQDCDPHPGYRRDRWSTGAP